MNYEQFRASWLEALSAAGMPSFLFSPAETIDLDDMCRTHQVYVHLGRSEQVEPFHATARLTWTWDALQTARTNTTEEDVLAELLGEEGRDDCTERPWLRVDVTLSATLPWGSPLALPEAPRWRRWVAGVTERLTPLMPAGYADADGKRLVLSWRGEPQATVQCALDGELFLTGVELSAWQGIDLPRQWDDPDRERDEEPDDQLADFARRVWKALREWNRSLSLLQPKAPAGNA